MLLIAKLEHLGGHDASSINIHITWLVWCLTKYKFFLSTDSWRRNYQAVLPNVSMPHMPRMFKLRPWKASNLYTEGRGWKPRQSSEYITISVSFFLFAKLTGALTEDSPNSCHRRVDHDSFEMAKVFANWTRNLKGGDLR